MLVGQERVVVDADADAVLDVEVEVEVEAEVANVVMLAEEVWLLAVAIVEVVDGEVVASADVAEETTELDPETARAPHTPLYTGAPTDDFR